MYPPRFILPHFLSLPVSLAPFSHSSGGAGQGGAPGKSFGGCEGVLGVRERRGQCTAYSDLHPKPSWDKMGPSLQLPLAILLRKPTTKLTHTYIHTHTHTHRHTHACTETHMHTRTYMHACAHTHACMHTHTDTHTCTHACTHACNTHTYTVTMSVSGTVTV